MKKHTVKSKNQKKHILGFSDEDFSRENFIEGGLIRPAILMTSFIAFVVAMFLILLGASNSNTTAMKWGGSLVIFSFIFNLNSIYNSLTDSLSIYRSMNLGFKFVLFASEVVAFNWVLTLV
ncbi:MAG: hypothetical protein KC550_02380 [Nanoarchaeota archaeon]|nr:hypothetical protein [Nanoarchaeota archaeon]